MPTRRATIRIDGQTRAVESARFGISIATESWDSASGRWRGGLDRASVSYSLNVEVDEHSGEDGAPQPVIEDLPVLRAADGRHPSLEALGSLTVREEEDDDDWEAWFGNDAPFLYENVVEFRGWVGAAVRVRWTARYEDHDGDKPFLFEGLAEFTGIQVDVRRGEDPDEYLVQTWGGQPLESLDRHFAGRHDYGPSMPPERRHTESYVYVPKGQPLPRHWTRGASSTP